MNLYLIGYRGAGKSSVARLLAAKIGWPWLDADELLEQRAGKSIRAVFDSEHEEGFRQRERDILRELAQRDRTIVATGGGVVLRPENRDLLAQGRVVWLTAPADILWQRLQADAGTAERRPNLARGGLEEVESLLRQREPWYRACAHNIVNTADVNVNQAADLIADWLQSCP